MSEGLRQAGFAVIGAVEIDARAADVYSLNHPTVRLWRQDIGDLPATEMLRELNLERGELDLLGGCPPCQGFSRLRTRNGLRRVRDSRNDLIYEFERLVRGLLPRFVLLENVPRLLTDRRLRDFSGALKALGYQVAATVLDVADFGVPQRRRRTVVIASREGMPTLPVPNSRRVTVRQAIGALKRAGSSGDEAHDFPERRQKAVRDRISAIPKNGGSRNALPRRLTLECHRGSDGFNDVYGRMAWDDVAPTITTGCFNPSKGRFLHPEEDRAITVREAALLQSFPPGYEFPAKLGKVKLAEMIGNALPPKFIRAHAEALQAEPVL